MAQALRPFLMSGVAFATAAAVAATVAIAPPMSPGDVQVAKSAEVALNADVRDLINTYFGQFPGDPNTPGTIHAFGVLQQLLQNATVNDPRATEIIDSYFEKGLSDVIRLLLTRDNPDPVSVELIDAYFNDGLADATRVFLDLFATPGQQEWIDTYFGDPTHVNDDGSTNVSQNGASGIAWKVFNELGLSGELRANLDTFFNAQTAENPQAVPIYQQAVDPVTNEPLFNPDGSPIFTDVIIGYKGNSNPARRGSFGVLYNVIKSVIGPNATLDQFWDGGITEVVKNVLMDATPDPAGKQLIGDYFDGGIDKVAQTILVAASPDQRSKDLWNEFFDNGITGVVRYLLTGPLPAQEGPPVPPTTMMLRVESTEVGSEQRGLEERGTEVNTLEGKGAAVDLTTVKNKVEATLERKPAITELSAPIAPVVAPDPVPAAPASVPVAPAPAPAAAPAPAPEATTQVKDKGTDDETATNVKNGNKVEPIIILPGGGTKSKGGGAWGWNGLADRVNGFVKGVQNATGGGAPAAADPGGAGAGGGEGGK